MLENAVWIILLSNGLHLWQAPATPIQTKWPLPLASIIQEDVWIIQTRSFRCRIYALN